MIKHTPLLLLLIVLVTIFSPTQLVAQASCDEASKTKLLSFEPQDPNINLNVAWKKEASDSNYTASLDLISAKGGTFTLQAGSLVDPVTNGRISSTKITLSPSITLEKGKLQELEIKFPVPPSPGNYQGNLRIYHTEIRQPKAPEASQSSESDTSSSDSTAQTTPPPPPAKPDTIVCSWTINVQLNAYESGGVQILGGEQEVTVNTVSESWLNFILSSAQSEDIDLNVKNTGLSPITVKDFSINLKGKQSNQYLKKNSLILVDSNAVIQPGTELPVSFMFNEDVDIAEDAYQGKISLTFPERGNETVSASYLVNRKMGVLGALLTLILGVLVGRMMKDVEKPEAQEQIKLLEQLVPLRAQVADMEDKVAKGKMLAELKAVEKKINNVKDEAVKQEVTAQIPVLDNKIRQLVEWQALWHRVDEKLGSAFKRESAEGSELYDQVNDVRDAILSGKAEDVKSGLARVGGLMEKIRTETTTARSADDMFGPEEGEEEATGPTISGPKKDGGILESISEINLTIDQKAEKDDPTAVAKVTFWSKAEDILFKVMNFLTGFQANARVRYALFRPIAMIVAFTVILLLGFQQIYVGDGGSANATFGSDGIYDYLKLFLWGLVSDVFSRSVFSAKSTEFSGASSFKAPTS